ncbi:MAG: sortase [Candidatus Shapirobacteria bacterium]|jgi:LPXTG-site transpeptidase (sortase) family protein
MFEFFKVTPRKRNVKITGRKGIIYSNPGNFKKLIFYVGDLLFVVSIIWLIYLYYPLGKTVVNYWGYKKGHAAIALITPTPTIYNEPEATASPTPMVLPTPTIEDKEYWIEIPKIRAKAEVIKDVSPFNEKEYRKVLEGNKVAQAEGTAEPGMGPGQSTYIFAHSTEQNIKMVRKNSVFYLLGELKDGDLVYVKYKGEVRTYRVYKQIIANADEIGYLEYSEPDKEIIILQTCWPIGTAWKRLLVMAEKI